MASGGGDAWGGTLAVLGVGTATVRDGTLAYNRAIGGDGQDGGNGLGGGVYVTDAASVRVFRSLVTANEAMGGIGGAGGDGVGGGVYNLGSFEFDKRTVIEGNDASTSHSDIYP